MGAVLDTNTWVHGVRRWVVQGAGDAKATFVVHKKINDSKKPVTQLLVVSELSTVLALCDGKILALSVSQLSKQANIIQGVQNADYMAVNTKVQQHTRRGRLTWRLIT